MKITNIKGRMLSLRVITLSRLRSLLLSQKFSRGWDKVSKTSFNSLMKTSTARKKIEEEEAKATGSEYRQGYRIFLNHWQGPKIGIAFQKMRRQQQLVWMARNSMVRSLLRVTHVSVPRAAFFVFLQHLNADYPNRIAKHEQIDKTWYDVE